MSNIVATRIKLVRAYFDELEQLIKTRKKLRKNQVLNVFLLLDTALINDLIDKRAHKAFLKFVAGDPLDTYEGPSKSSPDVTVLHMGYYLVNMTPSGTPKYDLLYPLPEGFIASILAPHQEERLKNDFPCESWFLGISGSRGSRLAAHQTLEINT